MYPIAENSQVKGRVQTTIVRDGNGRFVVTQVIDGVSLYQQVFEPDARFGQARVPQAADEAYQERISHARRYLHETLHNHFEMGEK